MNHAQQVRDEVGNGSTCPKHAGFDNEDVLNALIKTKENPQGILALVNEIICYHLAIDAGIAMPKSSVALIAKPKTALSIQSRFWFGVEALDAFSIEFSKFILYSF